LKPLEIQSVKVGEVSLVTIQGGLVLGPPIDSLGQTLDGLVTQGQPRLVLNMAGVDRLDSSGIGLLVKVMQSAKASGGALKLSSLPRVVVQTLTMCRLLPLFQVFGDDQEAVASFG
jgi:anti-sigma B factor antagonist